MPPQAKILLALLITAAITCRITHAQTATPAPFFFSGSTTIETQVSTVSTGDTLSIPQAVVSHDRKYVTIDANPSMSNTLAIIPFTTQTGSSGFVGSPMAVRSTTPQSSNGLGIQPPQRNPLTPSIGALPSDVALAATTALDQPGITKIAGLP